MITRASENMGNSLQGASRRKYHQEVGPVEPKIRKKEMIHRGYNKNEREETIDGRSA